MPGACNAARRYQKLFGNTRISRIPFTLCTHPTPIGPGAGEGGNGDSTPSLDRRIDNAFVHAKNITDYSTGIRDILESTPLISGYFTHNVRACSSIT